MLKSTVKASFRSDVGSNESNRLRRDGFIPGVLYGSDKEPKCIEVDKKELESIIREHGTNVILNVSIDDNQGSELAIIKEIQRHPVNKDIIHVDFQRVSYDKPVVATVPIVLVDRDSVENKDVTIQNQMRELKVECLPQHMPEVIEVSVKDLVFGQALKVANIEFSKEITILNDPNEVIATLTKASKVLNEEGETEPAVIYNETPFPQEEREK